MFKLKKKIFTFALILVVLPSCINVINTKISNTVENVKEKTKEVKAEVTNVTNTVSKETKTSSSVITLNNIPKYSGKPYVVLYNNKPNFSDKQLITKSYEKYSQLDKLGRCGVVIANIGIDLMPKVKRGNISTVKPTGWQTAKYSFIDGKYLYNRCHLIGYQLTAENANNRNLITGTRYMNIEGMLPFENLVADYVKETKKHVLYRVTPIYKGKNLVASGIQMEAKSVEDKGKSVCFNVCVYNVQPGIQIDYSNGNNWRIDKNGKQIKGKYVLNTYSKKIHKPNCKGANSIFPKNKKVYVGYKSQLFKQHYTICTYCYPE